MALTTRNILLKATVICTCMGFIGCTSNAAPEKKNTQELDETKNSDDSIKELIHKYANEKKIFDSIFLIQNNPQLKNKKPDSALVKNVEGLANVMKNTAHDISSHMRLINGVTYFSINNISYTAFVADLDQYEINLHLRNPDTRLPFCHFADVKNYLDAVGQAPEMITNAGMFTPRYTPQGLYIEEDSIDRYSIDTGKFVSKGNFYIQPNGVFYIDAHALPHIDTTDEFVRLQKNRNFNPLIATQSGPMMVVNGLVNQAFTLGSANLNIRNGVGLISEKKIVFIISDVPCNFYDFATTFKDIFGCPYALYLDGFISKMYVAEKKAPMPDGNFGPIFSIVKKM